MVLWNKSYHPHPPNSYVDVPTLNVIIFGEGVLGEVIRSPRVEFS